jgi:hypothetical protein
VALGDLVESAEEGKSKYRDRLIAVYIGALAVALAICSLGGGNSTKDATARNIEAANTWAFFQAKNIRRNDVRLYIDELELMLAAEPNLPESTKAAIEERIKKYRAQEARLTSEPDKGEGLDELFVKGKELEAQRDLAMRKDPYFDYGQAFLQIAIVLASVAIITGGTSLLVFSILLAGLGTALTLNGFTLAVSVPLIG